MGKIGILSGTFDPVHAGHITFALKAVETAGLDKVVIIPEMIPRRKEGMTHYAHRVAMLRIALKPYQKIRLLELPDKQFSVTKTMPRLKKLFPNDELYMLMGSDMVNLLVSPKAVDEWPSLNDFLDSFKLIISIRDRRITEEDRHKVNLLSTSALVVVSGKPQASSRHIRESLMKGRVHRDVLPSIRQYIKENWLYSVVTS